MTANWSALLRAAEDKFGALGRPGNDLGQSLRYRRQDDWRCRVEDPG